MPRSERLEYVDVVVVEGDVALHCTRCDRTAVLGSSVAPDYLMVMVKRHRCNSPSHRWERHDTRS